MHFYTSVVQRGNKLLVRGVRDGRPYKESVWYRPYLFVRAERGSYRSIHGERLMKFEFESIYEARDYVKQVYTTPGGSKFWGLDQFVYPYISDNFEEGFEYDTSQICVANIDIEADGSSGFPDPSLADKACTAITMIRRGVIHVFGYVDFPSAVLNQRIRYVRCEDEREMLLRFLDCWTSDYPDVITGWNVDGFDVPFLVNRIRRVLGEDYAKLLSPWKILDERTFVFRGMETQTFVPLGITVLDYLPMYRGKKFVQEPRESYTLNYIAHVELGESKVDYSEHGDLHTLWLEDPDKFMQYNVHDAVLVERLDEKLDLMGIVFQLAYGARTNYSDALGSVKQWEVILYNEMMKDRIVIDGKQSEEDLMAARPLDGGYVKVPQTDGFKIWGVSIDLDSLYSHLQMQFNISPETRMEKMPWDLSFDDVLNGRLEERREEILAMDRVVAANLVTYRKDQKGILPKVLEKMYNERKLFKRRSLDFKQKHEDVVAELKRRGFTEQQLKDEGIVNRV